MSLDRNKFLVPKFTHVDVHMYPSDTLLLAAPVASRLMECGRECGHVCLCLRMCVCERDFARQRKIIVSLSPLTPQQLSILFLKAIKKAKAWLRL